MSIVREHHKPQPIVCPIKALFTQKRFRLKTQTFLYRYTFRLHENGDNAHEHVFTSKTLSKVETFKNDNFLASCKQRK